MTLVDAITKRRNAADRATFDVLLRARVIDELDTELDLDAIRAEASRAAAAGDIRAARRALLEESAQALVACRRIPGPPEAT